MGKRKKLFNFSRIGETAANKKSWSIIAKLIGGGLIGEMLPSVFQRISGVNASGVTGNAVSGIFTTMLFLAMGQKEMAAGVVATKVIKATVAYGNPAVARLTSVPLVLPSTNDKYSTSLAKNQIASGESLNDAPPGVEYIQLPNGKMIPAVTREEGVPNPVVNYDEGTGVSGYVNAEGLNDQYIKDPMEALGDHMPELAFTDGY